MYFDIDTVSEMVYSNIIDTVSKFFVSRRVHMIKGTQELIAERREEIVNACETLYQSMSFKDITLKEIGNVTSFSRPTIYNYFQTKEEIFLALYEKEYGDADRFDFASPFTILSENLTPDRLNELLKFLKKTDIKLIGYK